MVPTQNGLFEGPPSSQPEQQLVAMTAFASSSHFAEVVYDPLSFFSILPYSFLSTSWSTSFGG